MVNAVADGLSPLEDVKVFARRFDVPFVGPLSQHTSEPHLVYRTPGALLLLSPFLLVDWIPANIVISCLGLICFLWMILRVIPKYCQTEPVKLAIPLLLVVLSISFREAVIWGPFSAVIGLLCSFILFRPHAFGTSMNLAVVSILRVYPAMLFFPLVAKREIRPKGVAALGIAVAVTLVGSVVFAVSAAESVALFREGTRPWLTFPWNTSLGSLLFRGTGKAWVFPLVTMLGVGCVVICSRRRPLSQSLAFAVATAVVVSPVSWLHYGLVLAPAVVWLWSKGKAYPVGRVVASAWLVLECLGLPLLGAVDRDAVLAAITVSRLSVCLAVGVAPRSLWLDHANETSFRSTKHPDVVTV